MSILNQFGVKIDALASGGKLAVGFQTPVINGLGDKVRSVKNYDSITKRLETLADVPEKYTKKEVVLATNLANRALARNVHKAGFLKARTTEFTALANSLKMEMQAKQQMTSVMDGAQQSIEAYGRAIENSKYGEDVLEAGYQAYTDELNNGGSALNLSGW
jgi:lipopolysaccharide biosynthesis regulator YciM